MNIEILKNYALHTRHEFAKVSFYIFKIEISEKIGQFSAYTNTTKNGRYLTLG